eukprot:scaffold389_cov62-Cyclotella_meneghiniana.AAC.9
MATTARIDIDGTGMFGGSIAVSRSMPAILNDRISSYAWTSICDDIDRALEPLNDAMKRLISTQSQAEMKKVCEDLSAKHQGVSFSLRDEQVLVNNGNRVKMQARSYIEVSVVSNNEVPTATAVPAFNPAVTSNQLDSFLGSGTVIKSSVDRMRELEEMRGLLTDEEYQRKRAEILSAV